MWKDEEEMDKNAIKKYAVWARTELIDRVRQRAVRYEVTADANPNADSASSKVFTPIEKTQRQAAIARMRDKGYEYVIEEVAYTWFNRFVALRYMEANNYLPSRVRVFTDGNGSFKPQILTEAIHLNLDGLDMEKVYALKEAEDNDELYKYLLITQCNALSAVLPQMFKPVDEKCKQEKDDYTILLFPDNLLREGSVVEQMVTLISEDNWLDAVQIIGWLYQYYNSEPKDKVFADLKKKIKITKENIPAATQLFTPDWIVRYMVENSLGRLWLEGHPQNEKELLPTEEEQAAYSAGDRNTEDSKWHYYLKEAEQEPEVQLQLAEIRKEYAELKPEEILCIDPCMGSGHILVYLFDALMKIYAAYGYSTRESVQSIIERNLYGLDIDDRAAQLAYFAVMMKAVQYDNRFLKRSEIPKPHVYAIKESNQLDSFAVEYFCNGDEKLTDTMNTLIEEMYDATEYGSILNITQVDFVALYARFEKINNDISMYRNMILNELLPFVQVAELLAQKYDVVVTNPPYMSSSGMGVMLSNYVKKNYPDSKSDLFAVFIERCGQMTAKNRYLAMITQHAWMFLSSFEKLRSKIDKKCIISMAHLSGNAFEEIKGDFVQTTTFVFKNIKFDNYCGIYCRLVTPDTQDKKEELFLSGEQRFYQKQKVFRLLPSAPIAYWVSKNICAIFNNVGLNQYGCVKSGMQTGNNELFLRYWHEINYSNIGFGFSNQQLFYQNGYKWAPQTKGGLFRRWYGNYEYVVNFENECYAIRSYPGTVRTRDLNQYFVEGITWTHTTAGNFGARLLPRGFTFNVESPSLFIYDIEFLKYYLGLLNSKITQECLTLLNSAFHYHAEDILSVPVIVEKRDAVIEDVTTNISISKTDWDTFETSWDFKRHPLIECRIKNEELRIGNEELAEQGNNSAFYTHHSSLIKIAYKRWETECNDRFNQLKKNEETLNAIFIELYGLQDELTPEVEDKDVTVRKADLQRDIKSLISYAVGCIFGRYSLDVEGLAYAGGEWDASTYQTFPADWDNIIPICDDEYFDDDITGLFVKFVETVYGKDTLDENLKFIADALGGKGTPKEVIRHYFLNDFYKDHCKMYQKRPIYWLFDSGKKNGFKALMYLHRYQPDTIARMRTDYVHEQQSRYRTATTDLENRIAGTSTFEGVRLKKQLTKLNAQSEEIHIYEEKIHHLADQMIRIDLDDGVKHNYKIFKDVLAKIK